VGTRIARGRLVEVEPDGRRHARAQVAQRLNGLVAPPTRRSAASRRQARP
jgi:hypothetical protein